MKIAFLYPGQGAQYVGMGKELFTSYPQARRIFEEAEALLGVNLRHLCLNGPAEELVKTNNLQPLLVTFSFAISHLLQERGVRYEAIAGHSLGEYSALAGAHALSLPDTLRLVRRRAQLMALVSGGAMAAVIGLETAVTQAVCNNLTSVWVTNENCPGQQVISGTAAQMPEATRLLREAGAKRILPLAVSGAFHSPLMSEAADNFSAALREFTFRDLDVPLVSNASGKYARTTSSVIANLALQMDHPVLWEKSMRQLLTDGFELFIEIGPGTVLQGLMKRISRQATTIGVDGSPETLERATRLAVSS